MKEEKRAIPFYPDHAFTELAVALVTIGFIILLAGMVPKELGEPANKLVTPQHILPEWYFLWMFQFLKMVPKAIGLGGLAAFFALLLAVPWLDRSPYTRLSKRPRATVIGIATIIIITILTFLAL